MASIKQVVSDLFKQADITVNGARPGDIIVHDDAFYSRVLKDGSLGLGESYMDGQWDCNNLDIFIQKVLLADLENKVPKNFATLKHYLHAVLTNQQTKKRAWHVGQKHYDIGNDLYTKMLDETMFYSCGYWKDAKTLHESQLAKVDLICRKLGLKKGDKVLDIGCGWGGFGRYACKKYGIIYTGITVSKEQKKYIDEKNKGLKSTVILDDYRNLTEQYTNYFDAIVSIGMIEHVGYKNYKTYMKIAHKVLKDGGKFLLHTIGGLKSVTHSEAWITKYIFTNSMLPSVAQLGKAIEPYFVMEDWHNFGPDYDKTLMQWYARFNAAWPQLTKNNPKYDERFKRMWNYYLLACAGSFRARKNQLWQIVLSKNPSGEYISVR